MSEAKKDLFRAYSAIKRVIDSEDPYVARDDRPELIALKRKAQELFLRVSDREKDDKAQLNKEN